MDNNFEEAMMQDSTYYLLWVLSFFISLPFYIFIQVRVDKIDLHVGTLLAMTLIAAIPYLNVVFLVIGGSYCLNHLNIFDIVVFKAKQPRTDHAEPE